MKLMLHQCNKVTFFPLSLVSNKLPGECKMCTVRLYSSVEQ